MFNLRYLQKRISFVELKRLPEPKWSVIFIPPGLGLRDNVGSGLVIIMDPPLSRSLIGKGPLLCVQNNIFNPYSIEKSLVKEVEVKEEIKLPLEELVTPEYVDGELVYETTTGLPNYKITKGSLDHGRKSKYLRKYENAIIENRCETGVIKYNELKNLSENLNDTIRLPGPVMSTSLVRFTPYLSEFLTTDVDRYEGMFNYCEELFKTRKVLEGINIKRGYVLTTDIFNEKEYPIVSAVAGELMSRFYWSSLNALEATKVYK